MGGLVNDVRERVGQPSCLIGIWLQAGDGGCQVLRRRLGVDGGRLQPLVAQQA